MRRNVHRCLPHFVRGSWYSPVNNLTMLFGILGNAFKRFKSFKLFPRTWPLVKQACPSLNKTDQTLSFVFRSRPLKIILIFTSRNKSYDNNAWNDFLVTRNKHIFQTRRVFLNVPAIGAQPSFKFHFSLGATSLSGRVPSTKELVHQPLFIPQSETSSYENYFATYSYQAFIDPFRSGFLSTRYPFLSLFHDPTGKQIYRGRVFQTDSWTRIFVAKRSLKRKERLFFWFFFLVTFTSNNY